MRFACCKMVLLPDVRTILIGHYRLCRHDFIATMSAICSFLPDKHDLRGDKICIKIAPSSEYLKQQKKFAIQENSCCVNL